MGFVVLAKLLCNEKRGVCFLSYYVRERHVQYVGM